MKNIIPTATIELVTPEMAAKYLECNTRNYRKLRRHVVAKYAADMKAGLWTLTTGGIGFDVKGELTNGQHRLSAVVESGVACYFVIVRGLPDGASQDPNEDTGSRRQVSTHLTSIGVKNGTTVASTARLLLNLRQGHKHIRTGTNTAFSDAMVAQAIANCQAIEEAASATRNTWRVATASVVSVWYFIAVCEDKDLADQCVQILSGQTESTTTHPFIKLRDALLSARADKSVRGGMENDLQLRFFMSAWEKAKANESVKLLRPATTLRISSQAARVIEGIEV